MATPELASGRLVHALDTGTQPLPASDHRRGGQVIEFQNKRGVCDVAEEPPRATASRRTRGFVYDGARAGRAIRAGLSQRSAASRPLPMEEVCLYIKDIDNSQLRRQADPEDRAAWTRLVILGLLTLIVTLASHAPHALQRQAGYRIEKLRQQYQAMAEINEQLKVRHAMMSDLRRVTELAAGRGLTDTPPERFQWQDRTIAPAEEHGEIARIQRPQP